MTKENITRHLISGGITFVATFFLIVGLNFSDPNFVFSAVSIKIVIFAALASAVRAVAKIVYELCYSLLSIKQ